MKKLAMSIMTYNRAKHIGEDLAAIAQPTKEQGIDIFIFDGSTNERTKRIVERYIEKGYEHIHYTHYFSTNKQLSSIERIMYAFQIPDVEYIWFCGDKFTIKPEYYSEILSYIDKSYDIITIYGFILKGSREFSRVSEYAEYAMVPLTLWGANIIKKNLVASYNIKEEMKNTPAFGITSLYMQAIAKCEHFKGVVLDFGKKVQIESRYKTPSGSRKRMWSTWVIDWYQFIERLPAAYEDVRERLYNKLDLQMKFFSLQDLLCQRSEGQYDLKMCWKYRKYVKKVIVMPYSFVLGISMLPRKVAKVFWLSAR